jgi:hypothetical protein
MTLSIIALSKMTFNIKTISVITFNITLFNMRALPEKEYYATGEKVLPHGVKISIALESETL